MPYATNADLPSPVKKALKHNEGAMTTFRKVVNGCLDGDGGSEGTCFKKAYGAVARKHSDVFADEVVHLFADMGTDNKTFGTTVEIPIAPFGSWEHPWYGTVPFDNKTVNEIITNFESEVLGHDLAVDLSHDPSKGAMGWFKKMYVKAGKGLYALVDFTKEGFELVKSGKFRYISPEIARKWTHPMTGTEHTNVLFGAALTNRPFLKGMPAIELSEDAGSWRQVMNFEGGGEMDPKLLELLGLKKGATAEQVLEAVGNLAKSAKQVETLTQEVTTLKTKLETPPDDKTRKFAEDYPDQFALMQGMAQQLEEAKVDRIMLTWQGHPESHLGLPPVALEQVRAIRLEMSGEEAQKFDAMMETIVKTGLVNTAASGSERPGGSSEFGDAANQFMTEVFAYQKEHKVELVDAIREVSRAKPDLAESWRKSAKRIEQPTDAAK